MASTKAFSAQVLTLWLLALYWGQAKGVIEGERLQGEVDDQALRRSGQNVTTFSIYFG